MKTFKQFLEESINISGDFNGTLIVGGSPQQENQTEEFSADIVYMGNIHRISMVTENGIPSKLDLTEYLQTDAPLDFTPLGNASSYSRTDTTITGGDPIAVFCVTSGAPETIDLDALRIVLPPQRNLTMAISSDSVLQKADAAVTFIED